ncbi:MAG: formylglycine-generating enzyme family protein [Caldilineaceae bacterium]|nr:formylglycine-generating enzyme family protein [Caldilineaceae bacterium]
MALNQQVRHILQQIVQQYGPFTSSDEDMRRCRGMLRDLAGAHTLEVNLLLRAMESRVPETLSSGVSSPALAIPRLIQELQNTHGISAENARWAVESWAVALGIPLRTQPTVSPQTTATLASPPKPATPIIQPRGRPATTPAPAQTTQTSKIVFDWVTIPAGEFLRGSDKSKDSQALDNETPQRRIYLSDYQIARVPVTNAQYKVFVDATGHRKPKHWEGAEIPKGKTDHPVVNISWEDAMAFCTWAGVHLSTEAEWEKAARGSDGCIYPWGNHPPDAKRCNFNGNVGNTTPVGNYSADASFYGVMDMAGNVWEWVNDWYDKNYYSISSGSDPHGPATGNYRVLRGGAWFSGDHFVRSALRGSAHPSVRNDGLGFRCARSP